MRLLNAICLLVILSGLPWIGFAADEAPAAPAPAAPDVAARAELLAVPTPLSERRYWSLRLDMVIFTPVADTTPYAINDPNNDGSPEGPLVGIDYNQDNEFRPVLQYNCTDGNTLFELNYLRLRQINDLDLPVKAGGSRYWTPLTAPNFGLDFAFSAQARAKLTYIEFNAKMQHLIKKSDSLDYFVDAGIRWVQIDHQFHGRFFNMNGGASTEDVALRTVINAGGFTFGAGMRYQLFGDAISGLDLSGRFGAFLLQGSLSGSYDDFNSGGGTNGAVNQHQTQLVPGMEAAVYLNYNPDLQLPYAGYLVFHAGYEMKNYFQVVDTTTFADDVHEGNLFSRRTSFAMTGYVFSLQFVWPVN